MNTIVGVYTEKAFAQFPVLKGELSEAPISVRMLIKEADRKASEMGISWYHNHYVIQVCDHFGHMLYLGVNDGQWSLSTEVSTMSGSHFLYL